MRISRIVALLLLMLCCRASAASSSDYEQIKATAEKLYADGSFGQAHDVYEKAKNLEIVRLNKGLERKSANFDNLNYRLNKLIDDHEKLLSQYEQSETIRN